MENWFYNYIDGSTNMDVNALAAIDVIDSQYKAIVAHHINEESKKRTIGINNDSCRFCGRNAPEVTFRQVAHALPNCIGNNILFGYNECDQCNNKFGRLLETHFANFMHLDHTILGVRGKKGFPKYKMDNALIETTGSFIDWKDTPLENIVQAPEDGMVHITQKMPGYIPVALYKSLVKMALTIIPEIELIHLQRTLEWISEDSHDNSKFKFDALSCPAIACH